MATPVTKAPSPMGEMVLMAALADVALMMWYQSCKRARQNVTNCSEADIRAPEGAAAPVYAH